MKRHISVVVLLSMFTLSMPVAAQEMPGEKELKETLTTQIPMWWEVDSISIEASVNDGDEVEPRIRQRFIATVEPSEDLYDAVDNVGPFAALIPVHDAGEPHKLYGIASSELRLGKWVTRIQLGNSVAALGKPRSFHEGPTVLADSEEFEKTSETIRILQGLKNRWSRSLSSLDTAVNQMKREGQDMIAKMRRDSQEVIRNLSGEIRTHVEAAREIVAETNQAVADAEARKQLVKALDDAKTASDETIQARKALYESLRAQLAAEDPDVRLAAFHSIFESDQYQLGQTEKQTLLGTVFKSGDPVLQGAALFREFSRKPRLPLTRVGHTDENSGEPSPDLHVITLKVSSLQENYEFEGVLDFSKWTILGKGTIRGDRVILKANACEWNAKIEKDGNLRGKMECKHERNQAFNEEGNGIREVEFVF